MGCSGIGARGSRLTSEMLREMPVVDIHVHLPGAIAAGTAWQLGVRNKLVTVNPEGKGSKWRTGPVSLAVDNPHEHYTDLFRGTHNGDIVLDSMGRPIALEYNIEPCNFKDFDRVMATVQGHRYPPGGIQTEDDLRVVLSAYLDACLVDGIFYTELQQNIKIAHNIYTNVSPREARKRLFLLLDQMRDEFLKHDVHIRFLNCFNKTNAAHSTLSTYERALEAVRWLKEAEEVVPGLFVGLESAGHEKDPSGWPEHLKAGYKKARELGFGCEAHGGEGIGSEHMMHILETLDLTRMAHGFQMIEDQDVIAKVKELGITLCMSPVININLGACVHCCRDTNDELVPRKRSDGGVSFYIDHVAHHPIFKLWREYQCKIAVCSDNPYLGGVSIKRVIGALAGLDEQCSFPHGIHPFTAEEIVQMMVYAIDAAFCQQDIKVQYKAKLKKFVDKYHLMNDVCNGQ